MIHPKSFAAALPQTESYTNVAVPHPAPWYFHPCFPSLLGRDEGRKPNQADWIAAADAFPNNIGQDVNIISTHIILHYKKSILPNPPSDKKNSLSLSSAAQVQGGDQTKDFFIISREACWIICDPAAANVTVMIASTRVKTGSLIAIPDSVNIL